MSKSITLHPKYGVNPSISVCFVCNEDKGEILLLGYNKGKEAPMKGCYDYEPCDKCKEYMKKGVILISVKDRDSGDNPYRTGGWVVVKRDMIRRALDGKFADEIIRRGLAFVPDEAWDKMGLPRSGEVKDE